MGDAAGPSDPGLAAERTSLAWSRTSLGVLVNGGLLLLRHFAGGVGAVEYAIVGLALILAALFVRCGRIRARQVRFGHGVPPGPSPMMVVGLGGFVAVFGLVVTAALATF